MTDNITLNYDLKPKVKTWPYKLLLFISFIWVTLYPTISSMVGSFQFGYGNVFNTASENFPMVMSVVLTNSLLAWFEFEILFYIYRYFLAFKVYSFIVPSDRLRNESRLFFIYRNIFYGIFVNLSFLYPYLYELASLVNLIITLVILVVYANHLNKEYSEPIVGHFVFKSFCYPIFVYEAIYVLIQVWGVLAWKS